MVEGEALILVAAAFTVTLHSTPQDHTEGWEKRS
jgi:hypothetical protein